MGAAGRPRIEFDTVSLEKLGALHCTYSEIAAFFGASSEWVDDRMAENDYRYAHNGGEFTFREIFEAGKQKGKTTLRRLQMKGAEDGDRTMLVWLGKQLLGQRDNLDLRHGGTGPGGEIVVTDARSAKDALLSGSILTAARLREEDENRGADGSGSAEPAVELAPLARTSEPDNS